MLQLLSLYLSYITFALSSFFHFEQPSCFSVYPSNSSVRPSVRLSVRQFVLPSIRPSIQLVRPSSLHLSIFSFRSHSISLFANYNCYRWTVRRLTLTSRVTRVELSAGRKRYISRSYVQPLPVRNICRRT